jgi:hypothetical protein
MLKYQQDRLIKGVIMLKTIYILAWVLVAMSAIGSLWGGYINPVTQVVFSVAAVVLVYALALWSVFTNTHDDAVGGNQELQFRRGVR